MRKKISTLYAANTYDLVGNFVPLGPLYLASFLKSKGFDVSFSDLTAVKNWQKKTRGLLDTNTDIVGLSSTVSNFTNTNVLARYIKSVDENIKIIVGGPYPTCSPEKYLENPAIDAVCIGEGEHTFYEYATRGDGVDGLLVRRGTRLVRTPPRQRIENLDDLPFPDLNQVELKGYHYPFQRGRPLSSIMTSRGCPFHCTFCYHDVHGHKWRARSPRNVVDEIKWQVDEFGVGELAFGDDNLTLDRGRVEAICDRIKKERIDLNMSAPNGVRVDSVDAKLLSKMRAAGFWAIALTPETGDPEIILRIQKGFSLDQAARVARWCKNLGFLTMIYLVIGFPFETKDSLANSLNLIKQLQPDIMNINKFYPFPGTTIVQEYGLKTTEGYDYRTLRMPPYIEREINIAYFRFFTSMARLRGIAVKAGWAQLFYSMGRLLRTEIKNHFTRTQYLFTG